MLSRLCSSRVLQNVCVFPSVTRSNLISNRSTLVRHYSKNSFDGAAKRKTLWERANEPPGPNAFGIGQGALAGASAIGLGALCFYGLGLASRPGAMENSMLWPQYVRERIKDTYKFFAGSVVITAGTAAFVFRTPSLLRLAAGGGWKGAILPLIALIASGTIFQSIEYQPGFGSKHVSWIIHSMLLGGFLAPLCFAGGPMLIRAAWYTAGVVGGLSTIAVCAPSGEFLTMGAPLAMGLGVVFASSLAGLFLPPTTIIGAGLYSVALYGGLIVFGGLLVYDTQRIIARAENQPEYGKPYDPITGAMSIYMDTINIFVRILAILTGGHRRRN